MGFVVMYKRVLVGGTVAAVAIFVVGILIGYFGKGDTIVGPNGPSERSGRVVIDAFQVSK